VTSSRELHEVSVQSGYGARPGALAWALDSPVIAVGDATPAGAPDDPASFGAWTLLTAMHPSGRVAQASTGPSLLEGDKHFQADPSAYAKTIRTALSRECATVVIDAGDLERAQAGGGDQRQMSAALMNTDLILGAASSLLDPKRDLLLSVSPTSPVDTTHLGVAVAVGPEFAPGSFLESASTRRRGIVTLPDVAPTVLAHFDVRQPAAMSGEPFFDVGGTRDRIASAEGLDREAVFIDATKPTMSWVFLGAELAFFAIAIAAVLLREKRRDLSQRRAARLAGVGAVAVAALPVATFAINVISASDLGRAVFIGLILLVDAIVVLLVSQLRVSALEKLGVVAGVSLLVILGDLITGGHLQLNSLLGDSPLIAGRFAGAGNNAFAIMGATAVVVATVAVWRQGRTSRVMAAVAALFFVVVVVDGAPQFGSDFGGVLALVPAFALTWILLGGKRISLKFVAAGLVAAVVVAGLFIAIDISRPPQQRTHLGRFFEDVRARGDSAFFATVRRKAASNLRQARSFQNLFRFLPAALIAACFLWWPLQWWRWLGSRQPVLRAGILGGMAVAVLGSALNDSGITIFTTMLLYLAPMAILIRLRSWDEVSSRPVTSPAQA
jgi:hypothetical protein